MIDILLCGNNPTTQEMFDYLKSIRVNVSYLKEPIRYEEDFEEKVNRYEPMEDNLKADPFDLVIDKTENKLSHSIINYICRKYKIPVL